jgi:hypothetical protein
MTPETKIVGVADGNIGLSEEFKIPGASWHLDSIDSMLALRILRANDWWDDFWNQRAQELMAA